MIRYNYTHLSHILTKDDIKIFSKLFFYCKEELDNKYYTDDYGDKNIPKYTFHDMYSVIGFEDNKEYILYYKNMHLYLEGILNKSKELLSTKALTSITKFFDFIVEIKTECRNNNIDMLFIRI